jgi:hypothetical protein
MKKLNPLAVTIAIALSSVSLGAMADVKAQNNAQPSFVTGNLGVTTTENTIGALKDILSSQVAYQTLPSNASGLTI